MTTPPSNLGLVSDETWGEEKRLLGYVQVRGPLARRTGRATPKSSAESSASGLVHVFDRGQGPAEVYLENCGYVDHGYFGNLGLTVVEAYVAGAPAHEFRIELARGRDRCFISCGGQGPAEVYLENCGYVDHGYFGNLVLTVVEAYVAYAPVHEFGVELARGMDQVLHKW